VQWGALGLHIATQSFIHSGVSYPLRCPTFVYEVIPEFFAGGSTQTPLAAMVPRLGHLERMGVDGLALTPLFPASDALRLHAKSFAGIDPALGTEAEFVALCDAARARGIGITLTGVFDHVSVDHHWFQQAKQQNKDDPRVPPEERTHSFFTFGDAYVEGYACRDGSADEPELDLANPEVRRRLFTGEDSVVHKWLQNGASGWRILRAEQVGYSILRELSRGVRTVEGAHYLLGDIRGFADRYQRDGLLDGVVNHYAREATLGYLKGEIPARQLARVERDVQSFYGRAAARAWMVLSGYDTPRLPVLLPDGARVRLATLLGFTLPGCAHVLFGEEVGISINQRVGASAHMSWDPKDWDQPTLDLHCKLGALRKRHPALRTGEFIDLTPEGEYEVFAFARVTADPRETVIVIANRAERPQTRKLFAPMSDLPDGLQLRDALEPDRRPRLRVRSGSLHVETPAADALVLVPDDADEASRRFFRGY
jgi:cyclomaltodextrinase / maltogenic alpha-amylase / neopullulanase